MRSAGLSTTSKGAYSACFAVGLATLQILVLRLSPSELSVRVILPLTIALAPVALWPHRRHIGTWMMIVGLLSNLAVILANGGLMPIEEPTVVAAVGIERAATYRPGEWIAGSKDVLVRAGSGHAIALGDSISLGTARRGVVVSPGDIVVWEGILVLVAEGSIAWQLRKRRERRLAAEERDEQKAAGGAATAWRATQPPS